MDGKLSEDMDLDRPHVVLRKLIDDEWRYIDGRAGATARWLLRICDQYEAGTADKGSMLYNPMHVMQMNILRNIIREWIEIYGMGPLQS